MVPASALIRTRLLLAARFARSAGATSSLTPAPALLHAARHRALAAKSSDAADVIPEVKEGVPGETPSIFDQATGLERAEIEHPDLFKHNEVLRGPFGTTSDPVMIQSNFDARIVGCTGRAPPEDHDLFWINVEKDKPCACGQCGQVFKLDPL
jgi:uncharacterized Zn-finger protein